MNAYYNNIGFGVNAKREDAVPQSNIGEKLISFVCHIVAVLTCATAVKIEKSAACSALVFAFFGIIGGMDSGNISMLSGLIMCIATSLAVLALLKGTFKKSHDSASD